MRTMSGSRKPKTGSRRAGAVSRRAFLAGGAGLAALGAYAWRLEPTWVQVQRHNLPLVGLPAAWHGLRIAFFADLHRGPNVPQAYLRKAVDQVAALECDLVAIGGDFVTGGSARHGRDVAKLTSRLNPPLGTFACLGNHDYGVTRPVKDARPGEIADALGRSSVRVLENEAVRLERDGEPLWIAGVEDLWTGRFDAKVAMADVPSEDASIVLCHNPDAAEDLAAAGCGAILSGHTHGGQVQVPLLGPPILPVRNRDRYEGMHYVSGTWLYITRGIGWLRRVRLNCRPEITVLTLVAAGAQLGRSGGGSS